jgi:cytochrome c oxidase cbb3-type subunit 3
MRLRTITAIALTLSGYAWIEAASARSEHRHVPDAPAPHSQPHAAPTPTAPSPAQRQPTPSAQRAPMRAPESSALRAPTETREPSISFFETSERYLRAPVTTLMPGNPPPPAPIANPVAGDPQALQRGMSYFATFNCVGCHAPNGGGGMGPSLSNRLFIYGGEPVNIYLSIYHGRPSGMPAWGATLSDEIIWDLVAYVQSISQAPQSGWGRTISRETLKLQQTPAEFVETARPWDFTQRFSFGRKPSGSSP